jgi:NAD(P)-dependent dehydrogenase (short-subunit alcohol dehydrogenase family)
MESERLNPVAMVCGAASRLGMLCAQTLSKRAEGGLILADADEGALEFTADSLTKPPERVSTLAFDPRDPAQWARSMDFIGAHYGRLDWLAICPPALDAISGGVGMADLDSATLALQSALRLQGASRSGGASTLVLDAHNAMKAAVQQTVRTAAAESAARRVRVNAIIVGAEAPAWRSAPALTRIDRENLDALARAPGQIVRCPGYSITGMAPFMLSDKHGLSGACLVVDDVQTL